LPNQPADHVPSTIRWANERLQVLDQRALPGAVRYLDIDCIDDAVDAIRTLAVRGAPAIGIAAAYALAASMRKIPADQFTQSLESHSRHLKSARPTAVNLAWAVERLQDRAVTDPNYDALRAEAEAIHHQDRQICQAIGEAGRHLITRGTGVLTHCNAGALAVSELGTATAPLYLSHAAGIPFRVFADETRPLLQGARLTAWELAQAGIDVTLLCDNAAASLMAAGEIDLVLVGTDRVTANGTLNLAVLAAHFNVPFYVACPSSTFDIGTVRGADVIIEHRDSAELVNSQTAQVAAYNPAFDVTPARLVTGLVTDRGLICDLDTVRLAEHFA
jgi:methylthioribose-1-phosphate isomerase